MTQGSFPFLSVLIWLPLVGALFALVVPDTSRKGRESLTIAMVTALATFAISIAMLLRFDSEAAGYQFGEQASWIPALGVTYSLGIDGISLFLVLLTTFLMPLILLGSHSVKSRRRGYLACMLVLESAMLGTLLSLDLFLFYVFWEAMLAPLYFIIGIWGGKRRIYASLKFVLYTVAGSVLMFLAIFYLVWLQFEQTENITFLLSDLLSTKVTVAEQWWLFGAFALAFGIKVPIFPFHTWLPDAHVEAPTGGSVVLAGVLLKMGIYGFLRFAFPLFPNGAEAWTPTLAIVAVIGIIYGALVAWSQVDMKKLVAYSSVSHLGYCVLGLVAWQSMATTGSIYQMINHGISTSALFILVGVLYDRTHTRLIKDYQGIASRLPFFAFLLLVFTLSSIALPLTNGFIGEFLILAGSFQVFPLLTSLACLGVVLGAVYMLTLYLKTIFGPEREPANPALTEVTLRESVILAPLFLLVFVMGVYPQPFLRRIEVSVNQMIESTATRREDLARYSKRTMRRYEPGRPRDGVLGVASSPEGLDSTTVGTDNI